MNATLAWWLRRTLQTLFIALLVLVVGTAWLLGTESGLRWTLGWVPGLQFERIEGRWWGGFDASGLRWTQGELAFQADQTELRWHPGFLTRRTLVVSRLRAETVTVILPPPTERPASNEPLALPDLRLPLDARVEDLQVHRLRVRRGEQRWEIDEMSLQATARDDQVMIHPLRVAAPNFSPPLGVDLEGVAGLRPPHRLSLKAQYHADPPPIGPLTGALSVGGDSARLRVQTMARLANAYGQAATPSMPGAKVTLTLRDALAAPSWEGEVELLDFAADHPRLQPIAHLPPLQAETVLRAKGDQEQLTLDGNARVDHPDFGVFLLELAGAAELSGRLDLTRLRVSRENAPMALEITGKLTAEAGFAQPATYALQAQWQHPQWPLAGKNPLIRAPEGSLRVAGEWDPGAGQVTYQAHLETQLHGAQVPASQWELEANGNTLGANLSQLRGEWLDSQLEARGELAWRPELAGQLRLRLNALNPRPYVAAWPETQRVNLQAQASVKDQRFQIENFIANITGADSQITLSGDGGLDGTDLDLQLAWRDLQWPLGGKNENPALAASDQGTATVAGSLEAYRVTLDTQVSGADLPTSTWRLRGVGTPKDFRVAELHGEVLNGTVNLHGEAGFSPHPTWNVSLEADGIQPQQKWPDWPGTLRARLQTDGSLANGQPDARLALRELAGKLRGYPVQAQARARTRNGKHVVETLDFQAAGAKLQAQGWLAERMDFTWQLDVPDLQRLLPQGAGRLRSEGQLAGSLNAPELEARVNGQELSMAGIQVALIEADAALALREQAPLRVHARVRDLRQNEFKVEQLRLDLQGHTEDHALALAATTPTQALSLRLEGGLDPVAQRWTGRLIESRLADEALGELRQQTPAALALSAQAADWETTCWALPRGQLCAQAAWQAQGNTRVKLDLTDFDLANLAPLLPPNLELAGSARLRADTELTPCDQALCPRGEVDFQLSPGSLATTLDDGRPLTVGHQGAAFSAALSPEATTAQWRFTLADQDGARGDLALPGLRLPPRKDQTLRGELTAQLRDFSLLKVLSPEITHAQGALSANLQLGGTLARPGVRGSADLEQGEIDLATPGLALRELTLRARGDEAGQLHLDGGARSGSGALTLAGNYDVAARTGKLTVQGQDFELLNSPDGWVFLSPDVALELDPKRIHVAGEVTIPRADLTPQRGGGGGVTPPSPDVVEAEAETREEAAKTAETAQVSAEVRVNLGEKVRVEAMGFKGRVQGSLLVRKEGLAPLVGRGEVNITGTYKSYGQDLTVEQGRVLFNDSPVENPGLDFRATRYHEQDEVTTGVRVRGTALAPEATLFSEPAMDQTQVLSYLVIGGPLNDGTTATRKDQDALIRAAAALPLGKSGFFTRQLAREFGLDDARVDSQGQLELRKKLSSRLSLQYTSSLFDPGHVLRLRYLLTRHLSLETQAGKKSGVDLYYRLER